MGLKVFELFIIGVLVFASIGGCVAYAIIATNNHKEQNAKTTVEPAPTNNNIPPSTSNSSQSVKTTQSPSTPAPSSDPPYNPYDTNGSPKDIYGCVLPPTNVSNLQLEGVYQTAYAGCVRVYKSSWCFAQASSAYGAYSDAILTAQTTYDDAKIKDEAYIQQALALGGLAGQQMVSLGYLSLTNDRTTYNTAYDSAYNTYSDAISSTNQQGGCYLISKYIAPVY